MEYYKLSEACDTKATGREYPQVQEMISSKYQEGPDSIYNLTHKDFPSFTPNLQGLKLHSRAKASDFISCIYCSSGYLINEKVKGILERFCLPEHRFYPATLHKWLKKYRNYYWLYYTHSLISYINFDKSQFYDAVHKSHPSTWTKEVKINDWDEYDQFRRNIAGRQPRNILDRTRWRLQAEYLLFEGIEEQYDILNLSFMGGTFASQRLIDALNQAKITGFSVGKNLKEIADVRFAG